LSFSDSLKKIGRFKLILACVCPVAGAAIGAAIGGPYGALIGALLGVASGYLVLNSSSNDNDSDESEKNN
jgi:hypothetical protein